MPPEDNTPPAVPDASQLNAADAGGAASTVPPGQAPAIEAMTLEDLNKHLGKQFPTKDAALKSIKDTFSYVGKKTEDIEKEVIAKLNTDTRIDTLAKQLEEERKERFYDRNPQYADPAIRKVIERVGGNPSDVVNSEEFKSIFNKVSEYDKSAKLKTVLESNPRLAVSRDNLQKAREIQQGAASGSAFQGAAKEEVERLATNAVKEAFEI
jgi:hypothetical protein